MVAGCSLSRFQRSGRRVGDTNVISGQSLMNSVMRIDALRINLEKCRQAEIIAQ